MLRVIATVAAALLALSACSVTEGPALKDGDRLDLALLIPAAAEQGLRHAAADLAEAAATITRAPAPAAVVEDAAELGEARLVIAVELAPDPELGAEAYRIGKIGDEARYGGRKGLVVQAATSVGAMYGLYRIAADLGVEYLHPEQTYFPEDEGARLPWDYENQVDAPDFELRGFHEHTQHPTPLSDFLLRSERADFEPYLQRYIRWLARNRQNAFSFMLLKTVDMEHWLPFIRRVNEEAHQHAVQVGVTVSFVDQQQNSFKIIDETSTEDEAEQIAQALIPLAEAGFDFVIFQIGSSEFTKPEEQLTLDRLSLASELLRERGLRAYAWIHITCSLADEAGGLFFHLPLQAVDELGAFVHTTMFYSLSHPAPVYDCEDFSHQLDFMDAADGRREQVFFPESAWWLGFDNNLPLVLPITGWSRAHDVQVALRGRQVSGHMTFTSGREWTYWQIDHFLCSLTWDAESSWESYLDRLQPLYGKDGKKAAAALKNWTALQVRHFYEENPLIYFYLAGELPQDEIGAAAGILARRPKLAFKDLLRYDDDAFAAWEQGDLHMLERMAEEYAELLKDLPERLEDGRPIQAELYAELYAALWVYLRRIEHTLALYRGVAAVRGGARADAEARLAEAQALSSLVIESFVAAEQRYRYPVELLCRDKPESPTTYPFGYLSQTSDGTFWTRRDEQLARIIAQVFDADDERWSTAPLAVFFTDRERISMTQPESALAADAIAGFVPRLLFGLMRFAAGLDAELVLAQDHNLNGLPDAGSEGLFALDCSTDPCRGSADLYNLRVQDSAGAELGELAILSPLLVVDLSEPAADGPQMSQGSLDGQVAGQALVDLVVAVGGIDAEGATALIKAVYGVAADAPLPATLPFAFSMEFEKLP